jgi:hypothetical protein
MQQELGSAPAPGAVRRASRRTFAGRNHRTKRFVSRHCPTGGRGVRQDTRGRVCSPFSIASFRLRIRVIQSFSGSQPLLAGRETTACGCILRACCPNPGARPSWPQHIRRPEKLLIMAWPVSRRDCCGRDARAPFGLGKTAPTTRRNPFLFTLFALPRLLVTACSLF